MKRRLLFSALLFPLALHAQSSDTGPIDKGSKLVGGSASVAVTDDENTSAVTSVTVSPNVLFFVAPRFAVGGLVGVAYSSSDNSSSTNWTLGPALRYFIAEPKATMLPFVGASVQFGRGSFSSGTSSDVTVTNLGFEGVAGITWMLARHVGLDGELFAQRTTFKASGGALPTTSEFSSNRFGVRFGISAFVF